MIGSHPAQRQGKVIHPAETRTIDQTEQKSSLAGRDFGPHTNQICSSLAPTRGEQSSHPALGSYSQAAVVFYGLEPAWWNRWISLPQTQEKEGKKEGGGARQEIMQKNGYILLSARAGRACTWFCQTTIKSHTKDLGLGV